MSDSYHDILSRSLEGYKPNYEEVMELLSADDPHLIKDLLQTAREIRSKWFGNRVFLYGFIYFSTHCRNDCGFCYYRRSNDIPRYRKPLDDIINVAEQLEDSGINLIDLTMGEDPTISSQKGYRNLLRIVSEVDEHVDLPIMVSPGTLPSEAFAQLKTAGADWFACYQETHNRDLFKKLRLDQDYDHRFNQKLWAKQEGMMIEEGIMIGVGEDLNDRADSIMIMDDLGAKQVRAMTFVPQDGTPMHNKKSVDFMEEIRTIAVMRLVHQDKLIPASLDLEGIKGVKARLMAGANVITSIVPPNKTLAGVAQHELDIDNGMRTKDQIEFELDGLDLRVADDNEYLSFMKKTWTEA